MTGGLAEWYNPADLKHEDFYLIRAAFQSGAVIGCLSVVSGWPFGETLTDDLPYRYGTDRYLMKYGEL